MSDDQLVIACKDFPLLEKQIEIFKGKKALLEEFRLETCREHFGHKPKVGAGAPLGSQKMLMGVGGS
jgi:hypothetical protein